MILHRLAIRYVHIFICSRWEREDKVHGLFRATEPPREIDIKRREECNTQWRLQPFCRPETSQRFDHNFRNL